MQPDNNISDNDLELLSRYIDGELPADESRALEARLHSDSQWQTTMLRMQELNHRLRDSLTEQAAIPEQISDLLKPEPRSPLEETGATVLNFPGGKAPKAPATMPRWAYAMAASLVAAVAIVLVNNAGVTGGAPGSTPWGDSALVSRALDKQSSGGDWAALGDGSEIQPVLTFPHQDGRWCREYLLRGDGSDWRAVACRQDGRWVTQAAGLEAYLESADAYRPAGASDSAPVAVFISRYAADIALGLEQESQLLEQGWPSP